MTKVADERSPPVSPEDTTPHPESSSELRARGIGSSDAPKIAGLNNYVSPYQLYMQKIGLIEPEEVNEAGYWGTKLEPIILQHYAKTVGLWVVGKSDFGGDVFYLHTPEGKTEVIHKGASKFDDAISLVQEVWHEKVDHMLCHLDGVGCSQYGEPKRFVEAKTAGIWIADEFGREGTDEIPKRYIVQCTHAAEVCRSQGLDLPFDVPTLIAGQQHKLFTVERNEKLTAIILRMNAEFWRRIQERDPPEIDGSAYTSQILQEIHPEDSGEVVQISPIDVRMDLVHHYRRAQKQEQAAKERTARYRNQIKALMEQDAKWQGENWSISYRTGKGSTRWKSVVDEIRQKVDTHIVDLIDQIIADNTSDPERNFSPSLNRLALPAPKEVEND